MPNLVHGIFDKSDVPPGDHSIDWYREDFLRLCSEKLGFKDYACLKQVHGDRVFVADKGLSYKDFPKADSIVTKEKDLIIAVKGADCAMVLFADPINKVVGACHAGRDSALKNIIQKTVDQMVELGGEENKIRAGVSPLLAKENHEIGESIYSQFLDEDISFEKYFEATIKKGKWLFDYRFFIHDRLKSTGLRNFEDLEINTYTHPHCFSYRKASHDFPLASKQEKMIGRKYALIGLRSGR